MRKYYFGLIAIALGFGLSAFTKPKTLDEKYKLDVNPTGVNLEASATLNMGGNLVTYYINWSLTASYNCPAIDDKGCAIEISSTFTYDFGGTIGKRIIKSFSIPLPGKIAYLMTVVNGYLETTSPFTQYKKLSSSDNITNQRKVANRSTPHI